MIFFKKNKKRKSGVKPKQKNKVKDFITAPVLLLTLIASLFIGSFIIQITTESSPNSSIRDLNKLLRKNLYEKETGHRIQIEILNGCGKRHIAKMYQDFLRYEGYDVMDTKNANSSDYKYSIIQMHRGDPKMAFHLSNLIGINDSLVVEKLDESLMFDLTLIIGNDLEELASYNSAILYHPNKMLILD